MSGIELYTSITRTDEIGDPVDCEVVIHATAACISRGYAATYMQPGEGPDYECTFDRAEFDGKPDGGPLTDAELATLRTWFAANTDKAWQAANDNFDDGPDPDEARGWRGLVA